MQYRIKIIITILFFTPPCFINAQWIQASGIYSGDVYGIALNGNNIYATTFSGIFTSTNNGLNWKIDQTQMVCISLRIMGQIGHKRR
jgi:hypothetical protein